MCRGASANRGSPKRALACDAWKQSGLFGEWRMIGADPFLDESLQLFHTQNELVGISVGCHKGPIIINFISLAAANVKEVCKRLGFGSYSERQGKKRGFMMTGGLGVKAVARMPPPFWRATEPLRRP